MATDPRVTAELDNFERADEDPLSYGGKWSQLQSAFQPLELQGGGATHRSGYTIGYSYWNPASYSGDIEVWGNAEGGNASGIAWALVLAQNPGGNINGYRYRQEVSSGGGSQTFGKYTNGTYSSLATGGVPGFTAGGGQTFLALRRINATNTLECWWVSASTWPSWTLQFSVVDSTYTGSFYLGIGITDNSASQLLGWEGVGGGAILKRPNFYRWVKV